MAENMLLHLPLKRMNTRQAEDGNKHGMHSKKEKPEINSACVRKAPKGPASSKNIRLPVASAAALPLIADSSHLFTRSNSHWRVPGTWLSKSVFTL
eukprot:1156579-Pelagomonas_calceolata.AAC.2